MVAWKEVDEATSIRKRHHSSATDHSDPVEWSGASQGGMGVKKETVGRELTADSASDTYPHTRWYQYD